MHETRLIYNILQRDEARERVAAETAPLVEQQKALDAVVAKKQQKCDELSTKVRTCFC